jgi:urease accessory protein
MERDGRRMRHDGPIVFTQCTKGVGVDVIIDHVLAAWREAARPSPA